MESIYILVWTRYLFPFFYINISQTFTNYGCEPDNCIVTDTADLLDGDFSKFHAVIFNIRFLFEPDCKTLPQRHSHQKYIALMTDPYVFYQFKDSRYEDFFNWTATYRLDSDIPYPFVAVKDQEGNVVGPKIDMHWEREMEDHLEESLISRLKNKTRAVAWFASSCKAHNKREEYVYELHTVLKHFGLGIDIYGECGSLRCPKIGDVSTESYNECDRMLGTKYFFYLAFENTFSEDYVSEKLLRAVTNDVVPVVFGGANYSRFLPPESYLDARKYAPQEMGFIMKEMIFNPSLYRRFFRWKSYYSYHDAMRSVNMCSLCAALNNKTKFDTISVYQNLTSWRLQPSTGFTSTMGWYESYSNMRAQCRLLEEICGDPLSLLGYEHLTFITNKS